MKSQLKAIYLHKSTIILDRELLRNSELVEHATVLRLDVRTVHNRINRVYCFSLYKYTTTYNDH